MLNGGLASKLGRFDLFDSGSSIAAPSSFGTEQAASAFASVQGTVMGNTGRISLTILGTLVLLLFVFYFWTRGMQA